MSRPEARRGAGPLQRPGPSDRWRDGPRGVPCPMTWGNGGSSSSGYSQRWRSSRPAPRPNADGWWDEGTHAVDGYWVHRGTAVRAGTRRGSARPPSKRPQRFSTARDPRGQDHGCRRPRAIRSSEATGSERGDHQPRWPLEARVRDPRPRRRVAANDRLELRAGHVCEAAASTTPSAGKRSSRCGASPAPEPPDPHVHGTLR